MKDLLQIINDYILGKPIFPITRKILNLLFNLSISYYFYKKCWGPINYNELFEIKNIIKFFIEGTFITPLSIFIAVYSISQASSSIFFNVFNHIKSVKLQRSILSTSLNKKEIEEYLKKLESTSQVITPINLSKELLIDAYKKIQPEINQELFNKIEKELLPLRQSCEANFIFFSRTLFALFFFKLSNLEYNFWLYITSSVCVFIGMILMIIYYRSLDIIPIALKKFHTEAEKYIAEEIHNRKKQL